MPTDTALHWPDEPLFEARRWKWRWTLPLAIVCLPAVAVYMYRVGAWSKRTAWILGILSAFMLGGILIPDEPAMTGNRAATAPAAVSAPARDGTDAAETESALAPSPSRVISEPTCADYVRMSTADRTTYYDGDRSAASAVLFGCNDLAERDRDALSTTTIAAVAAAYNTAVGDG